MTLAFLDLSFPEIILVAIGLLLVIAVGNYGKGTALGYWGSVLLAIVTTPLVAFLIIMLVKSRK